MAERVQKQRAEASGRDEAVEELPASADHDGKVAALDELLDEIDGVLEENAAAFVQAYVQKGGQ